MAIVIVYDSVFGNTAQIATAIRDALADSHPVRLLAVTEAGGLDLSDVELLIVGSPTRGFRPTPAVSEFVEGLDAGKTAGRRAAAFDTRMSLDDIHPAPLRWVVDAGGYAADRIAGMLAHRGTTPAGAPAGFLVGGTEGPLKPGEIERAKAWAKTLIV